MMSSPYQLLGVKVERGGSGGDSSTEASAQAMWPWMSFFLCCLFQGQNKLMDTLCLHSGHLLDILTSHLSTQ